MKIQAPCYFKYIRNHLLNDTHYLTVVIKCWLYFVIWKVCCVATVLMFGNGETKLFFVASLAAEQWTENDCKEVSHVWTFHLLLRKAPWRSYDLMHEGNVQSCHIIWNCLLVDERHLWWGEDVRDAACSGVPAAMTDVRCGAYWCCAWGRQQHNMNSNCSRRGNIRILLKQVGRRKVCAKWIPCILNEDQQTTCVMLVNVYIQWWRSILCLHFDSRWIVAALTESELKC